jgi:agmatine/peptidylarginine deiminase
MTSPRVFSFMAYRLPPEWHPQDGVMLAWPHAATDWAPYLVEVDPCYVEIARQILQRQALLLVCHNMQVQEHVRQLLQKADIDCSKLITLIIPSNDTWARDYGPLTLTDGQGNAIALDFTFNGWGGKYESALDNAISTQLLQHNDVKAEHKVIEQVLEGGAIEVDGNGHLLLTKQCLLNPNRNPQMNREQIEAQLNAALGTDTVLWLSEGDLEGDDTDAHIDTLARFAPSNTIIYVQCLDEDDGHFLALYKMEQELKALRDRNGERFRLIPLPFPKACYNSAGERLPATYANFLVINGAVLVPTYRQTQQDNEAIRKIQSAFPEHEIIGIDCLPLIHQFGSLHCISMQLPKGFLL